MRWATYEMCSLVWLMYSYRLGESPYKYTDKGLAIVQVEYVTCDIDQNIFEAHQIDKPSRFERMVPKRKCEFLSGRICARLAQIELGSNEIFQIGQNSGRSPIWPPGMVGSISHTGQLATACISSQVDYQNVGIDIEEIMSDDLAHELGVLRFQFLQTLQLRNTQPTVPGFPLVKRR
jgi:enterobactin synthetase component D